MTIDRRVLGAAVLLAAALTASTTSSGSPAVAQAAPPASVTLAGSFQSELGCPGDWQPECAQPRLTYEAGDDVWSGTFAVPAGAWEYKAALNGTWTESYGRNGGPDNIPLSLTAAADVRFYYSHATHWVADGVNAEIATAAGSFQDELGCPGDWQPDCLRSWLQDVDGDGVYTFTTNALPAGAYEWKAAMDESWAESYGAGGGPDNIPFTVAAAGQSVTFGFDDATNIPTVTVGGGLEPGDEELVTAPVRTPAADEVVYFMMTDRFADGSDANDQGGAAGDRSVHGYDPTGKGWYHGGDLAGLRSRLGYLQDMGVTAVWITPPFTNRWVQGSSAGYHGYWQTDYTQIDPHLGSNAEMIDLIAEAHGRGMKVYFDVVINHTADVITYAEGDEPPYRNKTLFPYVDASGTEFDDRDYAGSDTFPPLDPETSFPYTPNFDSPSDATAKAPAWLNDRTLYHNRGNTTFTGENSLYGDFVGLDDLFTEHPAVVDGMIDIHTSMIETFDVDGFRVDTVKHVNDELWEQFVPAVQAFAAARGKPDFPIFGEVFDGRPDFLSRFSTELPFPSTLDFRFHGAVVDAVATAQPTHRLRDVFADDDWFTDDDSSAQFLTKFVGNHDIGRLGRSIVTANPGASDDELVARARLAQVLNFTTRGTPVVYYGDEQGFTGDGGDQDARQDMFESQVATYLDDDPIGPATNLDGEHYDPTHPLYQAIGELAALRADHAALRQGAQLHRYSEGGPGVYAFSRIDIGGAANEYVVAVNTSEAADTATFRTDSPDTTFTALLGGGAPITSGADGTITVDVPALGAVVYRAGTQIGSDTEPDAIGVTAPAAGAEVTGRVRVSADVGGGEFAEVTFAVSVDGEPFEVIGVDDNAPYAVYHDVAPLEVGAALRYRAIVSDVAGNLNAAGTTAVVGEEEPPATGDAKYAVVHYQRADGDYGDQSSDDFNDFWGLHAWGDIVPVVEWTDPIRFIGEDGYGRFAWVELQPGAQNMGLIVHRGDTKDGTTEDRFINPSRTPEVWLKSGDATVYTSQAAADGFATIRYHRDDGVYDGWGLHLWGDATDADTEWTSPRPFDGVDEFGAFWRVPLVNVDVPLNFIIHKGDEKDPGPDQSITPSQQPTAWIVSGDETIHRSRGSAEDVATIHYHRPAGDYGDYSSSNFMDFWGMHVWAGATAPNPSWQEPLKPTRTDPFGVVFDIPLVDGAPELAHIIHRGDEKDPGPDMFLDLALDGYEVWQLQGADPARPYVLPIRRSTTGSGNLAEQRAYWVAEDTILWAAAESASTTYRLHHAPSGGLELTDDGVSGDSIVLTQGTADPAVLEKFPHLSELPALKIGADDLDAVADLLRGQVAVAATSPAGARIDATGLQIPGVLDDVYANDADLGVTWDGDVPTLSVWAPTAKSVTLRRFADSDPATTATGVPMTRDEATGVWSVTGDSAWAGQYYLYDVEVYALSVDAVVHNVVTDPYSLSLSTNSARSQIVDLSDPALAPDGWDDVEKPELAAPEDLSIYELHVRDFSISDETVPAALRGTFGAFTVDGSDGMDHLGALADAGLGAVHLLPAFDFATVEENAAARQEPDQALLEAEEPDSEEQQRLVEQTSAEDGFNWGYDPWHYTAPEGSYSTDPDGPTRIVEFRDMVGALNGTGLRVIMDVVYNHTTAGGLAPKSVLDRIVPGYYHRLNPVGVIETSTCCANTASEHEMMEKLLIDSVVTWARDYKVDGFRFDLMGHHSKANMLKLRAALDELTLEDDGVDGSSIYLYGEGWNFGEVMNDARFEQATQLNMAGTGIGTFNDRLRDAVRGGGPFDGGDALVLNQGVINGLWYDTNEAVGTPTQAQLNELLLSTDQIRVGLAGNLADYEFVDRTGSTVKGSDVDYNGSPAGYNDDPQEHIVYVAAHDNQTLWDIGQYHHPLSTSTADRVRAQNLGMDFTVLAQGVPFVHAGEDLLRTKQMDRNSYDSGDWFNRVDFSGTTNHWGGGAPPAADNAANWGLIKPRLAGLPAPSASDISASAAHLQEMLEVRESSPLFRLGTRAEVQERLRFHNTGPDQQPGLVVMTIDDPAAAPLTTGNLDPDADRLAVLFNPTDEAISYAVESWVGEPSVALHPVLAASADDVVGQSAFDAATGTFTVPARTTAVFLDDPDDTPPTLTAELRRIAGTPAIGFYRVRLVCADPGGGTVDLAADVNGAEVEHADLLLLIRHARAAGPLRIGNLTILWGPSFTLTATCTDAAGNKTTRVLRA